MHTVNTSQLSSGLVLAKDLVKDNEILVKKAKILDARDIDTIQKYFSTCEIYSLKELEPAIVNNGSFSSKYINFLVERFNLLYSSVFDTRLTFEKLSYCVSKELAENRDVLFSLIRLRQDHKYTYSHSTNVALLSLELGYSLGLSDSELHILVSGAILHDLGKLYIDNKILDKSGKLTNEEFELIKQHPSIGSSIANNIENVDPSILRVVREHHEKLDGSGYPFGLVYKDIHPLSKIVTICDIFDAITTKRSYHDAYSYEYGAEVLVKDARDGKIDNYLVQLLVSKTVMYPVDTFVKLSNGVCGFVVVEDSVRNRPVIYNCVNKKFYDLKTMKGVKIVYAV